MAALLAGSGFGDLNKKIVYVRKVGHDRDVPPKGRPRVQVTGPKVQPETCQICMGRIKEGSEYVHSACLSRVGNCPYCRRTFAIKGRESLTTREYVLPAPPAPSTEAVGLGDLTTRCPVCGEGLPEVASNCKACGAIFVEDGGTFPCPSCGFVVRESATSCAR